MYYDGNLAYKIEVPARDIQKKVKQNSHKKGKAKAKNNYKVAPIVKAIALVMLVFGVLFSLCWVYVYSYSQVGIISAKTKQLEAIVSNNSQLEMDIERATDVNKIYTYATGELGMKKPDKSQYVYITPRREDTMANAQTRVEEFGTKAWDYAKNFVVGIIDYFK
ncbi:MAG: hypothetical protein LBM38_02390 [Clostridiales bacterium]|jgi:cell division protein FtsL|nr:hypothetical protein [Clostridiales bacterium]